MSDNLKCRIIRCLSVGSEYKLPGFKPSYQGNRKQVILLTLILLPLLWNMEILLEIVAVNIKLINGKQLP